MDKPKKIVVTITSPRVIDIIEKRKGGITKKFLTEAAIENLYNSPETGKLLFDGSESIPATVSEKEKKPKAQTPPQDVKKFNF